MVDTTNNTKHLGVIIDSKFTCDAHVHNLCKQLNTALFVIKRTKAIATLQANKNSYHALLESCTRFAVSVWGGTCAKNLEIVLTLQKNHRE